MLLLILYCYCYNIPYFVSNSESDVALCMYIWRVHLCAHIFHIKLPWLQQKLSNKTDGVNWWSVSEVVGQICSRLYLCLANKEFPLDHMQSLGPFEGMVVREGGEREALFLATYGSLILPWVWVHSGITCERGWIRSLASLGALSDAIVLQKKFLP